MHWRQSAFPLPVLALVAISVVAVIVPFAPVLSNLFDIWNLQPEYSHGLIIPALSAFLIWRERAQLRGLPLNGSWTGVPLIAAGIALRYFGAYTTMHTLEHYAFLMVLYGLVLALAGPEVFRRLRMPLLILLFAVPLPSFFTRELSFNLQLVSSVLGVALIRATGVSVLLQGNVIDLGTYQLEVAEACSGLRYLFPLMTLAFIMVFLFRAPTWKRVVLFLSSIPITVAMNSLRIAFIGITVDRWGPAMAEGALHEFEGWLVFMFSTAALFLTALVLYRIGNRQGRWRDFLALDPVPATSTPGASEKQPSRVGPIPVSFAAAAALVLTAAVADGVVPKTQEKALPARTSLDEFPTQIDGWVGRRTTLEARYLSMLKLDDYIIADYRERDSAPVNLYVAYYSSQDGSRAIHSPSECIPGGGWQIQSMEQRALRTTDGRVFRINRVVTQSGLTRDIVYYWFQERGRRLTGQYAARWFLFWDALTMQRTDGALVRFVAEIPTGTPEADVDARIVKLALPVEARLARYIPE